MAVCLVHQKLVEAAQVLVKRQVVQQLQASTRLYQLLVHGGACQHVRGQL